MLFPIPYEDLEPRRLPWMSWGLIGLWIAGFVAWHFGGLEGHGELGLVPAEPQLQGFALHWILHASWPHLASAVLLLLLVGPALEALWGPLFFAAFFVFCALVSAAAYQLGAADSLRPFVGSSGAIAALMGAFTLRFFAPGVWFTAVGWWGRAVHARFWAPAYAIAGVWFACEVGMQLAGPVEGATRGVTYVGQIYGVLMGAFIVFAMQRFGLEERWLGILPEGAPHPALAAAELVAQAEGPAAALPLLESAAHEAPDDAAVIHMLCEQACAAGAPARAMPAFEPFVRTRLRDGENDEAAALWSDFARRIGRPPLAARLLVHLGEALRRRGDRSEAARVLRAAIRSKGFTPGLALRVVELSRDIHNGVALEAAAIALDAPQMHEAKRAKLESLVAELEITGEHADDPDLDEDEVERRVDRSIEISFDDDLRSPPDSTVEPSRRHGDPPVAAGPEPELTPAPTELCSDAGLDDTSDPVEPNERYDFADLDDPNDLTDPNPLPDVTDPGSDAPEFGLPRAGEVPDTIPILSDLGAVGTAPSSPPGHTAGQEPGPRAGRRRPSALPPTGFDLDDDTSPSVVAAATGPRFSDAKRIEAVPTSWVPGRIQLQHGSEPPGWLSLTQVEAIASGAVGGLAPKPVIVIDLLLNWTDLDAAALRIVRLRSDRFDPQALRPGTPPGLDAFRAVLEALLDETGGVPLPDLEGARGLPFRRFEQLDAYEREVLQIDV